MKYTIDTDTGTLQIMNEGSNRELSLYSREAFELVSQTWLTTGWSLRYSYQFTWLGRPIIQLPEDLMRLQEVIYQLRPDVIIETGVAHGGSLIFHASLCAAMGKGRVIGVEIALRDCNRDAIEAHPMSERITLIDGDSAAPETLAEVRRVMGDAKTVLVILDSNHTKAHVARELEAYAPLVSEGSFIVVTDGVMEDLAQVPGGEPSWVEDNPQRAALEFVEHNEEFRLDMPKRMFDESHVSNVLTYWPSSWLRRVKPGTTS